MKKKLALAAASILITLLCAEIVLRLLGIGAAGRGSPWFAGGNHPRFLFQPDAENGYTLRPNFQGREVAPGDEFDVAAVIDARGLRDHPHGAPAGPSVLALGDSMTFGEGVPAEEAWPAWLERSAGVRVYNAGVPGYSSRQMLVRLRRLLPALRPAEVVMTLSPLWDRQRCAAPFVFKDGYIVAQGYADRLVLLDGNLYLKETRLPMLGAATAHAKRSSVVMRLAIPAAAGAARALFHRSGERLPATLSEMEPTAGNVAAAQHLAESFGARFLAVLIDDRGEDFRHDRALLETRLGQLEVPFVAADALLPSADWPRLRFARDGHWNAAGHEAMGRALAGRMAGLLSPQAPTSGAPFDRAHLPGAATPPSCPP